MHTERGIGKRSKYIYIITSASLSIIPHDCTAVPRFKRLVGGAKSVHYIESPVYRIGWLMYHSAWK